jgi:hypothetical protein|tara:strand:+ start:599 stop:982 length:384 start_codon:yes stop_codon:yes gene_type:complete
MTNFSKPQLKAIREAMQSALEQVNLEGVNFTVANCTYNGGEATYKVNVLLDGAETKEQKDLTQMAQLFGLDTSKIKDYQGMSMSLIGYKSKAPKMPWIVQDLKTSKEYKLTDAQAEQWFKKAEEVTQ